MFFNGAKNRMPLIFGDRSANRVGSLGNARIDEASEILFDLLQFLFIDEGQIHITDRLRDPPPNQLVKVQQAFFSVGQVTIGLRHRIGFHQRKTPGKKHVVRRVIRCFA